MIKERLIEFIKTLGISVRQFEISAGLSNGQINNIGDSLRKSTLEKISKSFPLLNINWLVSGVGKMLIDEISDDALLNEPHKDLLPKQDAIDAISLKLDEVKGMINKVINNRNKEYIDDIIIDDSDVIDKSDLTIDEVYKFVLRQNKVILELYNDLTNLKREVWEIEQRIEQSKY